MQKEDKVCNITPANRVGSTGILLLQETEGSSRDERRRQERH